MYASELGDDEDDEELQEEIRARDNADSADTTRETSEASTQPKPDSTKPAQIKLAEFTKNEESVPKEAELGSQKVVEKNEDSVPNASHDASSQ